MLVTQNTRMIIRRFKEYFFMALSAEIEAEDSPAQPIPVINNCFEDRSLPKPPHLL
jgi:hypothetical protein